MALFFFPSLVCGEEGDKMIARLSSSLHVLCTLGHLCLFFNPSIKKKKKKKSLLSLTPVRRERSRTGGSFGASEYHHSQCCVTFTVGLKPASQQVLLYTMFLLIFLRGTHSQVRAFLCAVCVCLSDCVWEVWCCVVLWCF